MPECGPAGTAGGKGTRLGRHNKREFTSVLGKKNIYIYKKELKIYFKIFEKCIEKCIEKKRIAGKAKGGCAVGRRGPALQGPSHITTSGPVPVLLAISDPGPAVPVPGPIPIPGPIPSPVPVPAPPLPHGSRTPSQRPLGGVPLWPRPTARAEGRARRLRPIRAGGAARALGAAIHKAAGA